MATKQTPKQAPAPPKRRTDWDAVERDYRATNMTLRELGDIHHCLHSSIANKAKRDGWSRDLTGAIYQATQTALIEASVSGNVTRREQDMTNAVMATAEMNKNVILGHRAGLVRLIEVKRKLLEQIEQAVDNMTDLSEVVEMVRSPDDNNQDKANDALKKVLGRSSLVDDLKKLADVDEKVRKGEREAFRIDAPAEKPADPEGTSRYTDAERAAKMIYLLGKAQEQQAAK